VRPAMKRIVEELSAMDSQVGMLYEDAPGGKDRSSDSSRRTYYRSDAFCIFTWSSAFMSIKEFCSV
jgi:hypothetical protein